MEQSSKTSTEKYKVFSGSQILISFIISLLILAGLLSSIIIYDNFSTASIVGDNYRMMQMLLFLTIIVTGCNIMMFAAMFSRQTTTHWLMSWALVAFSADQASNLPFIAMGVSVEERVPYIILTFITYSILASYFCYSTRARIFYKTFEQQTEEILLEDKNK